MSRYYKQIRRRCSGSASSVAAAGGEVAINNVPVRGILHRVRVDAGSATTVYVAIRESSGGGGTFDPAVAYGTSASKVSAPLDEEEAKGVLYDLGGVAEDTGTLYVYVEHNAGSAQDVEVQLDVEPLR